MIAKLTLLLSQKAIRQLFRYGLFGVLTNLLGYGLYLLLTYCGGEPKLTMTVLYFACAFILFFANRYFTFCHEGSIGVAGVRYLLAQLLGYLLNFLLLVLFVDWLGFVHQIVQAVAIVAVAVFLFVLSRVFVFAAHSVRSGVIRS